MFLYLSASSDKAIGNERKLPSCPSRPTLMLGFVEGGGGRGGGGGGGRGVVTGVVPGRQPYRATPSRDRAREKSAKLREMNIQWYIYTICPYSSLIVSRSIHPLKLSVVVATLMGGVTPPTMTSLPVIGCVSNVGVVTVASSSTVRFVLPFPSSSITLCQASSFRPSRIENRTAPGTSTLIFVW